MGKKIAKLTYCLLLARLGTYMITQHSTCAFHRGTHSTYKTMSNIIGKDENPFLYHQRLQSNGFIHQRTFLCKKVLKQFMSHDPILFTVEHVLDKFTLQLELFRHGKCLSSLYLCRHYSCLAFLSLPFYETWHIIQVGHCLKLHFQCWTVKWYLLHCVLQYRSCRYVVQVFYAVNLCIIGN